MKNNIQEKVMPYLIAIKNNDMAEWKAWEYIKTIIRQEIEEAIPEEKHFINEGSQTEETGSWNNKNSYNQALSDIRTDLKNRGIL